MAGIEAVLILDDVFAELDATRRERLALAARQGPGSVRCSGRLRRPGTAVEGPLRGAGRAHHPICGARNPTGQTMFGRPDEVPVLTRSSGASRRWPAGYRRAGRRPGLPDPIVADDHDPLGVEVAAGLP